jgi:3-hydroxyisobutyrate dehydrogenase-like beta-hydroxyacid dehydrogenase
MDIAIASRFAQVRVQLAALNRTRQKLRSVETEGATVANSLFELRVSDAYFTMLSSDEKRFGMSIFVVVIAPSP